MKTAARVGSPPLVLTKMLGADQSAKIRRHRKALWFISPLSAALTEEDKVTIIKGCQKNAHHTLLAVHFQQNARRSVVGSGASPARFYCRRANAWRRYQLPKQIACIVRSFGRRAESAVFISAEAEMPPLV